MLSAVLRSEVAIQTSLRIMDTFVEMRRYLANTSIMYERLGEVEARQISYQQQTDEKFEKVFAYLAEHEEASQKIFFDGQIYDAFSLLSCLIQKAEKTIVLIDNYVDTATLNLLAKKKPTVNIRIYTHPKTRLTDEDVEIFNRQYPRLEVHHTTVFHDRFLVVDRRTVYHIGASLKDAGKKCFAVSLLEDEEVGERLIARAEKA